MALTFEQEPVNAADKIPVITNWTPMIGYMVYNDDIEDTFYFKLILEVYTGTSVVAANLIGKMKQRRNGYTSDVTNNRARAYFDLRSIVNTVLVDTVYDQNLSGQPFSPIHTLGANDDATKIFSVNGDDKEGKVQISSIYVKAYQEFSDAADTSPTEETSPTVNDTLWYIQATAPLFTARDDDADFLQSNYFQKYQGSSATDLFLSDVESSVAEYNIGSVRRNYIQETDYHTIAFLNDYTNFQSDIDWIGITYRDATGSIIGNVQYIANTPANGGWIPSTTLSIEDKHRLIYFGCGPKNLETSTVDAYSSAGTSSGAAQPSNFADWAYYTVAGYAGGSFALMTNLYYFIKQDGSCKGFKVRRLGWRNSLGCYDYFNFKMKSTQTINVSRNNYNTLLGRFDGSKYSYNDTQRGKTTRRTTAILKETLNTDWVTEEDANLLEKLIISTNVYVIQGFKVTAYTEGVIVTNSSFVRKTKANNKMIQYTINIEYANPVNTNS